MTRKEKRLKRRRKAERKKQRRIWHKGDAFQLIKEYTKNDWYFILHVFEKGIDYLPNPKPKSEEARKYIEKLIEGMISRSFGNIKEITIDELVEDKERIKKND